MVTDAITGIVLAGGRATRMDGRDKGLIKLAQKPMIEYTLEAIKPQVDGIIISSNRNLEFYAAYGFPVIADELPEYCGPLAGVASCLRTVATPWVFTAPCDSPLLPGNLVNTLYIKLRDEDAEICTLFCAGRLQPVFALIKSSLLPAILDFLNRGERKIDRWFNEHRLAVADFSDHEECFININSAEDLQVVEARLQGLSPA